MAISAEFSRSHYDNFNNNNNVGMAESHCEHVFESKNNKQNPIKTIITLVQKIGRHLLIFDRRISFFL
jgi:hypothetical protein